MHLVSLAAVVWDFPLVGRTRMLTEAWLRQGQPTTFVQVPSYRTGLQRLAALGRPAEDVHVVRPWPVYPARVWPWLPAGWLHGAVRRRAQSLRRQLERTVRWDEAVAIVVSPVWTPWLEHLPFRRVVYDCIDDLAVHVRWPELAPLYQRWEDELIQRACGAVVVAERLRATVRRRRPDLPIAVIRNGVDAGGFAAVAEKAARPTDVPARERPIVGFVGALYEWIDWDLMAHAVRSLSEYEFVFVGPHDRRGDVAALAGLPNTHFLGPRPYSQVPAYVKTFDVCWVPFRAGDVAAAANPVKIYEYLSLGKPVVTTPVADTDSFGALVTVARDPAEMVAQLRRAVEQPPADAAARQQFARANSWASRARAIVDFVRGLMDSGPRTDGPA